MGDDDGVEPAPFAHYLDLNHRLGVQYLLHHGVGAQVVVGPSSSAFELSFIDSGEPVLRRASDMDLFVDELLPRRLFRSTSTGRLCICDMHGSSVWHDDEGQKYKIRCFRHEHRDFKFIGEVYMFALRFRSSYVWWALNWFRQSLFPNVKSRWAADSHKVWSPWLSFLGLGDAHVRESGWSNKVRASRGSADLDANAPQEYSASSAGMLALLFRWLREEHSDWDVAKESKVYKVLACLMDRFLGGQVLSVRLDLGIETFTLHVEGCHFKVKDLLEIGGHFRVLVERCNARRRESVCAIHYTHELISLMRRPSRVSTYVAEWSQVFISATFGLFARQVDLSRAEDWWGGIEACIALQPCPRKGNKVARVSEGYKLAVVEASCGPAPAGTPRDFAAVQRQVASVSSESGTTVGSKSLAQDWGLDSMWSYWQALTEAFKRPRCLHFATDGVQLGGEKNQIYIAWDPVSRKMGYPPPQVDCSKSQHQACKENPATHLA